MSNAGSVDDAKRGRAGPMALRSLSARDESPVGEPASKQTMREHMPFTLATMQTHAAEWGMPAAVVAVEAGYVYRWSKAEARSGS